MDMFADKLQRRCARYYEKKCFFCLWHLACKEQRKALEAVREAQTKTLHLHIQVWRR
jgi:hypothetical protein